MNNIYVLNKSYKKIGTLSNQGANPQAPYYEDLYTQELETGADTYQFSTTSSKYTQDILEIGNHIMFAYKNRNELFTITSLEYSHYEGYKTIGVYAEGIGFDLLEVYMKRPENEKEDEGGRDEDNDGDTSTDDEYADVDDVYIDENGNIIYDKYGQDDYADPDNVSIDGDGNIIYRRNKRNREKDSLEFKSISYSRFLSILLKNTGWTYICQPGLESVKHDITVRYDTNIFALLQDSMQSYRGVELEFVHELVGGKVQKVIKAYKDGGRGSFVGKRFEYGTNVRGITKMQEVANSEDDTVLYVDNVGIAVQYDVDFALKSAEVPEIEIGDTHYVIDRDFCPPMQIKARIGKIEISFSDPTKNKIYLANNKKISGSAIEDEFGADDVADMLDDYEFDGDSGAAYDHYHDRLICDYTRVSKDPITGEENGSVTYQTSVILDDYKLLPYKPDYMDLGDKNTPWDFAFTNTIINKDNINSPKYWGHDYQKWCDREDMEGVKKITNSSSITKQDLLNFVMNDLNIYEYSSKAVTEANNNDVDDETALFPPLPTFGLLREDIVNEQGNISEIGRRLIRGVIQRDTNNDGDSNIEDDHYKHSYDTTSLLCLLISAFQQHVSTGGGATTNEPSDKNENLYYKDEPKPGEGDDSDIDNPDNPGSGEGGDNPGTDNPGTGIYVTLAYADEHYASKAAFELTELQCNKNEVDIMELKRIVIGSGSGGDDPSDPGSGGNPSTGNVFDTITVRKIIGPDRGEDQYKLVDFENGIGVSHIYCNSEDENGHIIIGDNVRIEAEMVIDGNILLEEGGYIEFPDGSKLTSTNGLGSGGGSIEDGTINGNLTINGQLTVDDLTVNNGAVLDAGLFLTVGEIACSYFEASDYMRCPEIGDYSDRIDFTVTNTHFNNITCIDMNETSDESLKENIRYIDASAMPAMYNNESGLNVYKENLETRDYSSEDLLEKADLYDFIVNQVNLCEFNYIDDNTKKIGFIANEYEGTKVGDRLITSKEFKKYDDEGKIIDTTEALTYNVNSLAFATIGALQEEVRIRDEQIASLEARLAKIEALLSNNDN